MAKQSRSKEIWHIPKRGSVHQTIYMVYCLTWDKFLGKSWSSGKQEIMASEMGKAGLTQNGKAISQQSVRTLLANVPKYLGFIYVDDTSTPPRIVVTDVGNRLVEHHKPEEIRKHKTLSKYSAAGDLIETSELFELQMSKLIITNPIIKNDCQNILVFPFRMTLRLLLELDYLDSEEIAYFLFHTKAEDEYDLVLEKIKNFRNLPPQRRQAEIDAYRKTKEGLLTLVKAPTSGYYMYLCYSTGLCKRTRIIANKINKKNLAAIKIIDRSIVENLLDKFEFSEIYDFKEDPKLWIAYFSNPDIINPPIDLHFTIESTSDLLVMIQHKGQVFYESTTSVEQPNIVFPVFHGESYEMIAYSLEDSTKSYQNNFVADRENRKILFSIETEHPVEERSKSIVVGKINEMVQGGTKGFDKEYYTRLIILGKIQSRDYVDNYRKGGRFEFLFFDLLFQMKSEGIIDEVFWYGKVGEYGMYEPAPGGKHGNPDIVFQIDGHSFVLELTTIKGNRSQWNSSEASSVPDHISNYQKNHPNEEVIGIFSAPSIHPQLKQNLKLNARAENISMLFIKSSEFAHILETKDRKELLNHLLEQASEQLS